MSRTLCKVTVSLTRCMTVMLICIGVVFIALVKIPLNFSYNLRNVSLLGLASLETGGCHEASYH